MIYRLGYAQLNVSDLEKSLDFYEKVLGFIKTKQEGNTAYLRAEEEFDQYSLILKEDKNNVCLDHFGLRVSSEEALDEIKEKNEVLGVEVQEAEDKDHGRVLKIVTPSGHPVAFYHQSPQINVYHGENKNVILPMRRTHLQNGIPPLRIDHMNLRVPSVNKEWNYWKNFDFSISEYVEGKDGKDKYAAWIRRETNTHDIALVYKEYAALHHVAFIVDGVQGVIRTADLLADAGYRDAIEYGPGRHGVSNAFFLYIKDPDGHRIEIYSDDYKRDLDHEPVGWTQAAYETNGRLWWGPTVPESFVETTAINKDWMKKEELV
ncbi:3,4-dihydroxyphenylacetate 2,3-dioxygenase [Oceanobacillus piezotolerans]|uniref:3,4-dihydroxyphenylacetate 2,3-dioxygenase n=1 Tax=Oceanobacillus piezotolerans TaxID=2448030 RepID=A0A498DED1_9BACI|nr:3,4-dihydroxyphenylacetate 2,3-dioxygenase [Oceanobacillus piezotolerans]RLL47020.1 3,4-dihydroxyphenylacetate 2,3-dioxygenase [Oceanobacillus piezotolerans]